MSARPFGSLTAALTAGLAGAGCMVAELSAVRLQAPWFGDSAYVWTNVIGVILAALAGGAALGGALGNRAAPGSWLVRLCLAAGLLLCLLPFLAAPLGRWLLPPELPLDAAMPAMVRGSLVATAVLFAPPMLLLGAVGPLLVALSVRAGRPVGSAAGAVSAAGTLGSLCGTFAATHWLVPGCGCRLTMAIAGALLLLAAAIARRGHPARLAGAAALLPLLLWGLAALVPGPLRSPLPGRTLLAERETAYQLLQVVREEGEPARTLLLINEGLDSFHSVAVDGSPLTNAYYDWHAIAPLLAGDGNRPAGLRALSIGDAAGSLRAVYAAVHPGAVVDGVDIDPATMELGERHFPEAKAPGNRHALDGRVFANLARATWHVVHVDAYSRQLYIPAHLASREFFAAVAARLADGGVVACNVGALRPDDAVLRAIGTTLGAVFGHAQALQVPRSRNFLLVARKGRTLDPAALAKHVFGVERLDPADAAAWQKLVATCAEPRRWHDVGSGGATLVDDRPVLDELMMQSYVAVRGDAALVACGQGRQPVTAAEVAAFDAGAAEDWLAVLAAAASSAVATPYLGELAGDARWSLRELTAAQAEYAAARAIAGDDATRTRLEAKLAGLARDLDEQQRALAIARRNGWCAGLLLLVGLLVAAVIYRMSRMPAAPSVSVLVAAR